jgi:hypothetical protein
MHTHTHTRTNTRSRLPHGFHHFHVVPYLTRYHCPHLAPAHTPATHDSGAFVTLAANAPLHTYKLRRRFKEKKLKEDPNWTLERELAKNKGQPLPQPVRSYSCFAF